MEILGNFKVLHFDKNPIKNSHLHILVCGT